MPSPAAKTKNTAIYLVAGDDEFSIKQAAAKLAVTLTPKAAGEFGVEIIEGDCTNQDEALRLLGRLNEALFTVGFFGGNKLVWLKNTELLADNRAASAEAVKDLLADLAGKLKAGLPAGVRLLISALGVDKRRTLFKTLEKTAAIQVFEAPDATKEAGQEEIAAFLDERLRPLGKTMDEDARQEFQMLVAPVFREIANELEKLDLYVGPRPAITAEDVRAVCCRSRQSVIWELTDSLGTRRLPAALRALANLLANGEAPLGVLAMLVNQFRLMLLARDLMTRKVLAPAPPPRGGFQYFQSFQNLPAAETAHFPRGKEGALPNGWRLYRCALAAKNFTSAELVRALELLTDTNRQLVSTGLDERLVLENALVKIAWPQPTTHSR